MSHGSMHQSGSRNSWNSNPMAVGGLPGYCRPIQRMLDPDWSNPIKPHPHSPDEEAVLTVIYCLS